MTDVSSVLAQKAPNRDDVLDDASTFSPRSWKTGWPHHLGHVPPYKDDAIATISRREVFQFAADVKESGFDKNVLLDFIGATFAFCSGRNARTQLSLQQFLRNKGHANELLRALRSLDGLDPVEQYTRVSSTGLAGRFASALVYFLAGPQEGGSPVPVMITDEAATALDVSGTEWDADQYSDYLSAVSAARDGWDPAAPLDCVEFALSR